jgi:diaminobutyrate-2-oxoglutarate transaminase
MSRTITTAPPAEPPERRSVPGPRSAEALRRQARHESSARSYPRRIPIAIDHAAGPYVTDLDGQTYIDFLSGAGVLALGHNHPRVAAAVEEQLGRLVHGLDFPTAIKQQFTEGVLGMLPAAIRDDYLVHFCGPTGADAVEAAIKLCKTSTGGSEVLAFQGAYHGCTAGAMAVTGSTAAKQRVASPMPGVHFFPFSYCHRCPLGLRPDSCATNCATYFERSLGDPHAGIARPAAAIIEIVQGEGGNVPAVAQFAQRVRRATAELGIPLIVDEIQSGFGRTGTWFAFEQYDIVPDVVLSSKALGGIGLPVSVMLYRRELDAWAPGSHIGTFRGNNLAFAAGVAALRVMRDEDVLGNVRRSGRVLSEHLDVLRRELAIVADTRRSGLMAGIELADPRGRPDETIRIALTAQRRALEYGLIVELGGRDDSVLRLLPPLNIERDVLERACAILRRALWDVERQLTTQAAAA